MSSPAKAHEPTMEEILASIRRIISDDEPSAAKPAAKPAAAAEPTPAPPSDRSAQDDVDAMLAEMNAPAASPAAREEPAMVAPAEFVDDLEVLELTEDMQEEAKKPALPAPSRPAAPPHPPRALAPNEGLLSSKVDEQVTHAFGSLAHTVLAGNARTLDDIVREMLRPMLRAWLDDNLPPLVERLVRQEIERVARGGR